MGKTIKIGGELESVASGHVVAAASAIKDNDIGKYQHVINRELTSAVNGLDSQNYVNLTATSADTTIADVFTRLDVTPSDDTIYRIANWKGGDGYNTSYYSEYSANGTTVNDLVLLTVENRGIDDEPVAGSSNLVKSDGVYKEARKIVDSYATSGSDLEFADEGRNVIVQFKNGHIKTKNFDSSGIIEMVGALIEDSEMDDVLDGELPVYLTDINGKAVLDNSGKPIEII